MAASRAQNATWTASIAEARAASVLGMLELTVDFGVVVADAGGRVIWSTAKVADLLGSALKPGDVAKPTLAALPGRNAKHETSGAGWVDLPPGRRYVAWLEQPVDDLPPAATLVTLRDETDARHREEVFAHEESLHRLVLEAAVHPMWELDLESGSSYLFGPWEELLGKAEGHATGLGTMRACMAREDADRVWGDLDAHARSGEPFSAEFRLKRSGGRTAWVRMAGRSAMRDGKPWRMVGSLLDISDRKFIEQAQKLEAMGRLAGGVAHDFNNLLTIVQGHAQLVAGSASLSETERAAVHNIIDAAHRGASLTRQMLSMTRSQSPTPRVVSLNQLLDAEVRILPRVLGEHIEVRLESSQGDPRVLIDPDQLRNVLTNLVVNARDAMPDGGLLVLASSVREGRACIEVRDNGQGIPPEAMSRIFDPFFTTKAPGKGTGLGLPSAMGIITHAGGVIEVESKAGQGAIFRILLPLADASPDDLVRHATASVTPVPAGRILLVEDDSQVRAVIEHALRGAGHHVASAGGGDEAMTLLDDAGTPFDLLITDVVMPRMGGKRVTEKARARMPALKVLYISGYAPDSQLLGDIGANAANFLQKPFSISELQRKVGDVLGR